MANIFPGRLVESVNDMIGKVKVLVLKSLSFNIDTPYLLEAKDQDGNIIDSLSLGIENIEDLNDELDGKLESESDPTVPQHVKDITTGDITNWDKEALIPVYVVHKSLLTTVDEAGLKEYWDAQTFEKDKQETVLLEIDENDYSASITSPTEGASFEPNEDITITLNITGV